MTNQESYSMAWGSPTNRATESNMPFLSDADAKAARDKRFYELKKQGIHAKRSSLTGQLRQYWGLGVSCGIVCTVYYLNWEAPL